MENIESQKEEKDPKKKISLPFYVNARRYMMIIGAFTIAGVLGGFAYYSEIGCTTGSCAITSNPYMSMVWGGAMGFLIPDFFIKKQKQEKPPQED